jgi:hypothetical protein
MTVTNKSLYEEVKEDFARWCRSRQRKKHRAFVLKRKAHWAAKTDEVIIAAHRDAVGWLMMEDPTVMTSPYELPTRFSRSCRSRLQKHILPEMKKRGIDEREYTLQDFC